MDKGLHKLEQTNSKGVLVDKDDSWKDDPWVLLQLHEYKKKNRDHAK